MKETELSQLTDEELLQEAKKRRTAVLTNSALIGFIIGIIVFSVVTGGWGWLSLILLVAVYKLATRPKADNTELDRLLKERKLK